MDLHRYLTILKRNTPQLSHVPAFSALAMCDYMYHMLHNGNLDQCDVGLACVISKQ